MIYVVVVAIVNLALGFAVAVYSGRGPWAIRQVPMTVTVDLDKEIVEEPPKVTKPAAVVTEKKKETKAESIEWQTTITPPSESDAAEPPAVEPEKSPKSASAADASPVTEPEPVEQPTDPLREAFDEIAQRLDKYRQQIRPIEKSLFDAKVVPEIAIIERQSKEVIELNHKTLRAVGSSIRMLESLEPTSDSMSAVVRAVCDAAVEFTDEIRQATEEIDAIDTTAGDVQKLSTELRPHVLRSNVASINLQNALGVGQGFARVSGSQGDDAAETSGELPPIEQWCDRAAFETALTGLWEANAESDGVSLPSAIGTLDIDGVMGINQQYGTAMGDKILSALTKFILKQRPKDTRLGKESNQRFLFLFAGTEPSEAAMKIEKIRQKIEKIRFEYRGSKIPLTASCAIVESREDDGLESLFERLDSTIQEAKNYGRNRTFLFEGDYPAPVVPPDVDVDV